MNVIIQEDWFSLKQCAANPRSLYIFGDNTIRVGTGGQAIIRPAPNSYGIATKRLPTNAPDAFFSDSQEDFKFIMADIAYLMLKIAMLKIAEETDYDTIVLPADGLGTGLSKMPEKSPVLCKWLHNSLSTILGVDYHKTDDAS